jgi:lipopolysaccharide export system permease protein
MIWKRYFLKEALKVFCLVLFSFYFLYALIDYSIHMQDFIKDKKIQIADLLIYYGVQFIKRANLLIPLALLIASIKVLSSFNMRRELVALQTAGISTKTLTRPFFLIATFCSCFSLLSSEFLLPKALNFADQFHNAHFRHAASGNRRERMHVLTLKDNSKLVYQTYNSAKNAFFDVIWIRSADDIWRIKYLRADSANPVGEYADHLQRNAQGEIEKVGSFDTLVFDEIKWRRNAENIGHIPIENRKISELYRMLFQKKTASSYEISEVLTQFCFKLLLPSLSFLCVIAIAPFCVRYSRGLKLFFLYSFGLFGFIAFYALLDAAVIIGENHVVSPIAAILFPFAASFAFFSWKFGEMK